MRCRRACRWRRKFLDGASIMDLATPAFEAAVILGRLGLSEQAWNGGPLTARSPITGETTGAVRTIDPAGATAAIETAHQAFLEWRKVPAPRRGELIRLFGEELRANKT